MRLDMGAFNVRDVAFGSKTALSKGILTINKKELRSYLAEAPDFRDVELDILRPGDSARVIHALDVVEPRFKVQGQGGVFPGWINPPLTVGSGKTHRLSGVAVVTAAEPVPGEPAFWREAIIDMSGPGAEYTPFSKTVNLVLSIKPNMELFPAAGDESKDVQRGGRAVQEYSAAVTSAGCKAAEYLAKCTAGSTPDSLEAFELSPVDKSLLKVVVLYHMIRPVFYGIYQPLPAATLFHPNESFDGAIVNPGAGPAANRHVTYVEQNNELLVELCRRHGKDVNFLGHILFGGITPSIPEKERTSSSAAKLAKMMGAQAAVVVGINGSNLSIDIMLTVQKCEQAGIKTTVIHNDCGLGSDDPGFVHFVPEADAIVCTGTRDAPITLPPVERAIGGTSILELEADPLGEVSATVRFLMSANNLLAMNRVTTLFQ